MTNALAAAGAKPDMIMMSSWDPALLLVDALRKLGPDASAPKLHAYLMGLKGWVGTNGPYDFKANPQRGLDAGNVVVIRWDAAASKFIPVSKPGGSPLTTK